MTGTGAWIGLALIVILLVAANKLMKRYGRLGQASQELKELALKQREGRSVPEDLPSWEACLQKLKSYPSDYNRLELEIQFLEAFALYLTQHYPSDARLPELQAAGGYRKDTIWGVKIQRKDQ